MSNKKVKKSMSNKKVKKSAHEIIFALISGTPAGEARLVKLSDLREFSNRKCGETFISHLQKEIGNSDNQLYYPGIPGCFVFVNQGDLVPFVFMKNDRKPGPVLEFDFNTAGGKQAQQRFEERRAAREAAALNAEPDEIRGKVETRCSLSDLMMSDEEKSLLEEGNRLLNLVEAAAEEIRLMSVLPSAPRVKMPKSDFENAFGIAKTELPSLNVLLIGIAVIQVVEDEDEDDRYSCAESQPVNSRVDVLYYVIDFIPSLDLRYAELLGLPNATGI